MWRGGKSPIKLTWIRLNCFLTQLKWQKLTQSEAEMSSPITDKENEKQYSNSKNKSQGGGRFSWKIQWHFYRWVNLTPM